MTSRSPLSAETMHAAPSHASATELTSVTSAGAREAPIEVSRSREALDVSFRTRARTDAPREIIGYSVWESVPHYRAVMTPTRTSGGHSRPTRTTP